MDNVKSQKTIQDNELLAVSFGTTSPDSRRLNIGSVEQAIEDAVGEAWSVRRAFTSQMIINIINKKEGSRTESITEALERAARSGVRNLVVQPTHLMKGIEYDKIRSLMSGYADSFENVALGDPLLTSDEDFSRVADALVSVSEEYEDGETAFVFMGHGTEAAANSVYGKMQSVLLSKGKTDYYVGTVEAAPSLEDAINAVRKGKYRKVMLRPLMLVAGNHAVNDMASPDDPESWYSRFTAAGYDTECIIEGLGQIPAVRAIYADHAFRAITSIQCR